MELPVLIERFEGSGYRAAIGPPFDLSAEGPTRDEALQGLRRRVEERVSAGAEVVGLEIPQMDNPWLAGSGMFKNDPLYEKWKQAVAEYRRNVDEDPRSL